MRESVLKNRSYRRFHQETPIRMETLRQLVNLARLSPSGSNYQPLKYLLINEGEKNALVFETLSWAGYLSDWDGPDEGERPSAYVVILGDTSVRPSFGVDPGIAAQSIMLGAVEQGLGGCIIAGIKKKALAEVFDLPDHLEVLLVLALGEPGEEVRIEPIEADGDVKYWRDSDGVHHVPKRSLDDLIIS
jgi:nitroreductase